MKKIRFYRKKEQYVLYVVIGAMIIAGFYTYFSQKSQDKLDVYTKSDKVENADTSKKDDEGADISLFEYEDTKAGFKIGIPEGWQKITKGGFTTYVHAASGSSIQLQVLDYDPSINNDDETTLSTKVSNDEKTFVSFTKNTTSNYEIIYQDFKNTTYDYMEEVYWDRAQIIKLVCTFKDENYEKMLPYYKKINKSFKWNKTKEIPEDYTMYYNDAAKFEIGVPTSWALAQTENAIVATDSESGASLTMSIMSSDKYLDTITATDMSGLLKNGKSNFIMANYSNTKDNATMSYSYVVDNIQILDKTYVFANGQYLYFMSFDYESGTIDEDLPLKSAKMFKEFITNTSGDKLK